jgi:hypothetical protein
LVGGGEVKLCLMEVGPSGGLVAARVYNCGEFCKWTSVEEISNSVDTSYFILDVEVEFL